MLTFQEIRNLKKSGLTCKKIADFKGVSERTIYRWNKKENFYYDWNHRYRYDRKKWGRKPKLTGESLKTFLAYIDKNNDKTQEEMADYASQLIGQPITRFIISRTLKKQEIRRKRISYHYLEQSAEKIEEFQDILYPLLDLPILALDECSFHLGEAPRYGYAKWGSRVNSQRTDKKSINYTLVLCIANLEKDGVVLRELIKGGFKAENFHGFLTNVNSMTNEENYLLMDNVRIHHATNACRKLGLSTIKELLASKNIKPLFLPPYTPELNPTELCFNFIRHYVEKFKPQTYEELEQAMEKVMDMLDEKDMSRFFSHCSEYFEYKQKAEEGVIKMVNKEDKEKWDAFFKE